MDDLLQSDGVGNLKGFRGCSVPEQDGGDLIYSAVGALSGKDRGNEELERGFVVQRGARVWEACFQTSEHISDLFDG